MLRIAILLLAACSDPPKQAFVVDGFVDDVVQSAGSVIGLWEIAGSPPSYYKQGDGVRLGVRFTLGFDTDPPSGALNPNGIGVAFVALLPELTTIPDGPVNPAAIGILGISANTAIVYKAGDATGPAWTNTFGLRFSCAHCLRNQGTAPDTFELATCVSVLIEGPGAPLCAWF